MWYLHPIERIAAIDGFGAVMAQSVYDYFRLEGTKHLIAELKALGVTAEEMAALWEGGNDHAAGK